MDSTEALCCYSPIILFMILVGLLSLNESSRDFLWELRRFNLMIKGIDAERSELWDFWQTVGGVISIIIGIVAAIVLLPSILSSIDLSGLSSDMIVFLVIIVGIIALFSYLAERI